MNRVVVTGMGAVSPFGFGVDTLWQSLLEKRNGISEIRHIDLRGDIVKIAGCLPEGNYEDYFGEDRNLFSRIPEDDSVKKFFIAVYEALEQSGVDPRNRDSTDHIAVCIADRKMGLIDYIDQFAPILKSAQVDGRFDNDRYFEMIRSRKIGKKSPYDDSDSINHYVSRVYDITGPQLSVATACASGNNAIGEAFFKIKNGYIDMAIAGGAYNLDLNSMIGFTRIGALTNNPDVETACRPFDMNRDGFVMGSGCGILVLESMDSAERRGAEILGEVKGYGYYSDAHRSTDPDPNAETATATIKSCLEMARILPEEIGYISAHGTSTKMNDRSETKAIKNALGEWAYKIPVSSTKSMIGHSIMAAAAIEGIVCIKTINDGVIHPTRNYKDRDPELDLDYVPGKMREKQINYALSNSFGFGGQNTSLLFAKYNP